MTDRQVEGPNDEAYYDSLRHQMVQEQLIPRGISDPAVLNAIRNVPRHLLIPPDQRRFAYRDSPLPIGSDQTISQPYIVAYMTQLLQLSGTDRVLEIGVGSGYQTAILCQIAAEVIGIERLSALAAHALSNLQILGVENCTVRVGDGTQGYPPGAPYDAILVAAAGPKIPQPLLDQLADKGRLIIPVGEVGGEQTLYRAWRRGGSIHIESLGGVRFVPLIGRYGFPANI